MGKPTILAFLIPVWQGLGALCWGAVCLLMKSPLDSSDMKGCIMPEKKMKLKCHKIRLRTLGKHQAAGRALHGG